MSRFSAQLEGLLKAKGWSKSDLARAMDKNPSTLHPYFDASYRPTRELICDLYRVLEPAEFIPVLMSHLRDETPENAQELIRIMIADSSTVREDEGNVFSELPADLRESLAYIAKRAMSSSAVLRAVKSQAEMLQIDVK